MCGLGPLADAIVGTLGIEERKRTTIGVELAAKVGLHFPSFVYLRSTRLAPAKIIAVFGRTNFRP